MSIVCFVQEFSVGPFRSGRVIIPAMRLLTFNSHQPYLYALATALPWSLGVVIPRISSGAAKPWDPGIRPLPDNVTVFDSFDDAMRASEWDLVLSHNIHDLLETKEVGLPRIFLVHGTITGRILQDGSDLDPREYAAQVDTLLRALACRTVYISELKKSDWGIPGTVIETAFDAGPYGGYTGEVRGVLQVSNHLKERGAILGWRAHDAVCRGLDSLVLGRNPKLPGARPARDWDDLKSQYRRYRVYLHTAVHPYEDGFNLALMEAMATGMPIATMAHPTSPITDGVEGVVADDAVTLKKKVSALLGDPDMAATMGRAARRRVRERFPLVRFQEGWQQLAAEVLAAPL